jgi:hypothetical protein
MFFSITWSAVIVCGNAEWAVNPISALNRKAIRYKLLRWDLLRIIE